jgi:hypothetical protein
MLEAAAPNDSEAHQVLMQMAGRRTLPVPGELIVRQVLALPGDWDWPVRERRWRLSCGASARFAGRRSSCWKHLEEGPVGFGQEGIVQAAVRGNHGRAAVRPSADTAESGRTGRGARAPRGGCRADPGGGTCRGHAHRRSCGGHSGYRRRRPGRGGTRPPSSLPADIVSSDVAGLLSAVTVGRREDGAYVSRPRRTRRGRWCRCSRGWPG